jgi:predicted transcriptional regulator
LRLNSRRNTFSVSRSRKLRIILSEYYRATFNATQEVEGQRQVAAIFGGLCAVLPECRFSRTLKSMVVHFSPDVETRLQRLAVSNGKDAEQLVKDTVARMLDSQARFIAGVQKGIEQADRGEFIEHKDVLNRIDRLFHS